MMTTRRSLWIFATAALAVTAAGCDTRMLSPRVVPAVDGGVPTGTGGTAGGIDASADGPRFVASRKVDILFVIDDSVEMRLSQDNLIRNVPGLLTQLMAAPVFADLHIAVISTDMGAGDGTIASCDATGGKNGVFQFAPTGTCSVTGLNPGATYIADDGRTRNYTGNIADVFGCIANLGEFGCGFERQFAAMLRALGADGQPAPPENQGFLRDDAFLLVVMLTNEDDCSAVTEALYDTQTNMTLASLLGPPANFRCNEFGHLCNGVRPPRLAPSGNANDMVTLPGCVSAEGTGYLIPVADIIGALRTVKPFPDRQIVVAAISGPPTPYTVTWHEPFIPDTGPWPQIAHSCAAADGASADPAVRIAQWVGSYGDNGSLLSICDTSYSSLFDRIAALLSLTPVN
jgi:hypothetical protein